MTIAQIRSGNVPPARAASPGPTPPSEGSSDFAQMMALQAPVEPAEPAGDADAPARPDDARQARARQAARSVARGTQGEARREAAEVGKAEHEMEGQDDASDSPAVDPALMPWLAHWQRPVEEAATTPTGEARKTLPDGDGLERVERGEGRAARPAANALAAPDVPADGRAGHGTLPSRGHDKGAERTPALDAAASSARDDPAAAAAAAATREPAAKDGPVGFALPAGFEPVAATATPANPSAAAAADGGLVSVPIAVPMEAPEFAAAFGVEVSLLAQDGVQQAELHLNPAEMGPVSVQIALDGEKARIDFGAQAAATRAAIEASLPELAAALRDAGLTLAGGGVSQHAGQGAASRDAERRDGAADRRRIGGLSGADAPAAPPRAAWRSRAGGVDLYA